MILMACDQSVRGFAYAAAPVAWNGDWSLVSVGRKDGGPIARTAPESAHQARQQALLRWLEAAFVGINPGEVGFESYAYSAHPDVDVVELTGMIKRHLWQWKKNTVTINQSQARKFLLGKVPRNGAQAKEAVRQALMAAGAPAELWTYDHTDALCILNYMWSNHDGVCFAAT